jgi:hypothetical protein
MPRATLVLTGIFPRNDNPYAGPLIKRINTELARLADGKRVRFLNVNDQLADPSGRLREGMMNPDQLHPAVKGYQVWADALRPILAELLGPPAATDHAPAPTGDPSARPLPPASGVSPASGIPVDWSWGPDRSAAAFSSQGGDARARRGHRLSRADGHDAGRSPYSAEE